MMIARAILWLSVAAALCLPSIASARPWRGNPEIVVILCEAGDADTLDLATLPARWKGDNLGPLPYFKPSPSLVRDKLVKRGTGSMADFYRDWSNGVLDIQSVRMFGWYVMPDRFDWFGVRPDTAAEPDRLRIRLRIRSECIKAAQSDPAWIASPPGPNATYILIAHPFIDLSGSFALAVLPQDFEIGDAVHEVGHALGLWIHSYRALESGAPGMRTVTTREYGNSWDSNSWQAGFTVATPWGRGASGPGLAPVGLAAPYQDLFGWIPHTRLATHGADGLQSKRYCLTPLDEPLRGGWLMVRVPLSTSDPFSYLTVEYRNRNGAWGRGVQGHYGRPWVLINKVKRDRAAVMYAELQMEQVVGAAPSEVPSSLVRAPVTDAQGTIGSVEVQVVANDAQGCGAVVEVRRDKPLDPAEVAWIKSGLGPNRCAAGQVNRDLDPYDYTCVSPTTKAMHDAEGSRWRRIGIPASTVGRCPGGLVVRNAFPGDDICVAPASAQQAAIDNLLPRSRFAYDQ